MEGPDDPEAERLVQLNRGGRARREGRQRAQAFRRQAHEGDVLAEQRHRFDRHGHEPGSDPASGDRLESEPGQPEDAVEAHDHIGAAVVAADEPRHAAEHGL